MRSARVLVALLTATALTACGSDDLSLIHI